MKDSPHAWLSYALDADGLIEKQFKSEDLTIVSFRPLGNGSYALVTELKGVEIGADATAENLSRVFSVEGASALKAESFTSESVNATFGVTADGKLSVVATPKSAASALFMRVCMEVR